MKAFIFYFDDANFHAVFTLKRRPISKSSIFWEEKKQRCYLEAVSLSEKLTLPFLNGGNEKNVFGILLAAHSFYDAFEGFLEVGFPIQISSAITDTTTQCL